MPSEYNSGESEDIAVSRGAQTAEMQSTAMSPLTEDEALAQLKQPDVSVDALEQLSKNSVAMKSRKVKLALAGHPRTPRHVSLPMVRHFFTFDLMQLALTPVVPADVKKATEDALIHRLEMISSGERLTLARRASGRVAGELLLDAESRVMLAALENSRLTEAPIIKALMQWNASPALVHAVCHHVKWSLRREVRIALLRSPHTPMAKAVEFARGVPIPLLREILQNSRLPQDVKAYLLRELKS
ncbi:MAG TPA: hypothetical protein VGG46_07895 [Terriglobales bacterium]